jgi:hypothetical protein
MTTDEELQISVLKVRERFKNLPSMWYKSDLLIMTLDTIEEGGLWEANKADYSRYDNNLKAINWVKSILGSDIKSRDYFFNTYPHSLYKLPQWLRPYAFPTIINHIIGLFNKLHTPSEDVETITLSYVKQILAHSSCSNILKNKDIPDIDLLLYNLYWYWSKVKPKYILGTYNNLLLSEIFGGQLLEAIRLTFHPAAWPLGGVGSPIIQHKPHFYLCISKRTVYECQKPSFSYFAVSHSWGAAGLDWTEAKNEGIFGINWKVPTLNDRDNKMLQRLESINIDWCWIDWYCIPQEGNKNRKNHEIAYQGEIFKNAITVVVFLHSQSDNWLKYFKSVNGYESVLDISLLNSCLLSMLDSLWFKSTWTLQEAWLRQDAILFSSSTKLVGITIADIGASLKKIRKYVFTLLNDEKLDLLNKHQAQSCLTAINALGLASFGSAEASGVLAAAVYRTPTRPEDQYNALKEMLCLSKVIPYESGLSVDEVRALVLHEVIRNGELTPFCSYGGQRNKDACTIGNKGSFWDTNYSALGLIEGIVIAYEGTKLIIKSDTCCQANDFDSVHTLHSSQPHKYILLGRVARRSNSEEQGILDSKFNKICYLQGHRVFELWMGITSTSSGHHCVGYGISRNWTNRSNVEPFNGIVAGEELI